MKQRSIPASLTAGIAEHKARAAQPAPSGFAPASPAASTGPTVPKISPELTRAYKITNADVPPEGWTMNLPLDIIEPDPHQPRIQEEFDETRIQSMADSLKEFGQIDALKVYAPEVPAAEGGKFVLSGGEYRWKAGKLAHVPTLRCHIVPRESTLMALRRAAISNEQRSDHGPVSRARLFTKLQSLGMTQKEIARDMGWNKARVSEIMTVAKLPDDILGLAAEKKWGLEALLHLARANEPDRAAMLQAAAESGVLRSRATETVRKQRREETSDGAGKPESEQGRGGVAQEGTGAAQEDTAAAAAPKAPAKIPTTEYTYRSPDGFHLVISGGRAKKDTLARVLNQAARDLAADKGWTGL